jgi:ubiquitin C-terminal hydrolase
MNKLNDYFKGFNNIGNTCYLNSGLQLIIHNKDLCKNLIDNDEISNELTNFIIKYYNDENYKSLTPKFIKDILSMKYKELIGTKQCDSSVFILYLIELLNTDIYDIQTNITIKCKLKTCLNKSIHTEKDNVLFLSIDDNFKNLDDCYRNNKIIEQFPFYCEKCKNNSIVSKRTKIIIWPDHLIIILKRFTNNLQKICKSIDMPIKWRHNYILKGFIYHSGNIFGGHYIYIGNKNDKWIMFNDESLSEVSVNDLNNYKNFSYIFYYSKI